MLFHIEIFYYHRLVLEVNISIHFTCLWIVAPQHSWFLRGPPDIINIDNKYNSK